MAGTQIVGILNVTPDSYYDGGQYATAEQIARRALEAAKEGADIIEIGAESTGPGSSDIGLEEELRRIIPALQAVRSVLPDHKIALDTYRSGVLSEAVKFDIHMINDVTAGRADEKLFPLVAELQCKIVLMHAKDPTPRTTRENTQYDDVVSTVRSFLMDRVKAAKAAGIRDEQIILDPGLGHFVSADSRYSFQLLRHLHEVTDPYPSFVSPSRKSFVAGPSNLPTSERLPGTLAATAIALEHGASYVRTHDVKETRQIVDLLSSF